MLRRVQDVLHRIAAGIPGLLVLLALGTVAVVGYLNDWKLPHVFVASVGAGVKEQPAETTGSTAADPSGSRSIHLSTEAIRKSDIQTVVVAERPMSQYIHAHGSFDYDQTHYARLGPRAAGVVWQVYRRPGDAVREGDVLALVESAEVGRVKAAFLQSLVLVEAREKSLQAVQAQAKVVPGAFPEFSLREAASLLREARARLFADQQALFNLGLPVGFEEVAGQPEEKVMQRLRLLGLPSQVVQQLDPNTATANLLPMKAPLDGMVVGGGATLGEAASPERPLFLIADLRNVWLTCEVRLEDVGLLALGQEVAVRPDGADDDAPLGKLTWISAEADDKTHAVQARAQVANPEGKLRPNTPFEGRILIRRNPRAIAVPSEAVQWDGRSALVFVRVSDEEYQSRPVRVGVREGEFTEILSGVAPGEVVVARGSHVLKAEQLKDRIGGDD